MSEMEYSRRLPTGVVRFALALIFLLACCLCAEAFCREFLHLSRIPYRYPFSGERFPDLLLQRDRFVYFHTLQFFSPKLPIAYTYPAPDAVVYEMFFLCPRPLLAFLSFALLSLLVAVSLYAKAMRKRGAGWLAALGLPLTVLLCCFPLWCDVKQANLEIVVWALTTLGVFWFVKGRGYSSAACFGLAASMKIYPLAYLALLLVRKQYRQLAFGLGVSGGASLASLWLVYPSIGVSWVGVNRGVERFKELYMLTIRPETGTDHSLFAVVKQNLRPLPEPQHLQRILTIYLCVVTVGGLAVFLLRIRKLPIINQVLCLGIATILFPPVSFEYTLVHMLVPLGMLVLVLLDSSEDMPGSGAAMVCFAVILSFLPELILHGRTVDGEIKALFLMVLFLIGLVYPFGHGSPFGDPSDTVGIHAKAFDVLNNNEQPTKEP